MTNAELDRYLDHIRRRSDSTELDQFRVKPPAQYARDKTPTEANLIEAARAAYVHGGGARYVFDAVLAALREQGLLTDSQSEVERLAEKAKKAPWTPRSEWELTFDGRSPEQAQRDSRPAARFLSSTD